MKLSNILLRENYDKFYNLMGVVNPEYEQSNREELIAILKYLRNYPEFMFHLDYSRGEAQMLNDFIATTDLNAGQKLITNLLEANELAISGDGNDVVGIEKSDLIEKAKEHLLVACDEFAEYFDSSVDSDLVINHVNSAGRAFATTSNISNNFLNSLEFDDDVDDINAKDTIIYKDFYIIDLVNKVLVYVEILYTNIENDGLVVSHSGVLYSWDSVEAAWTLANDNNFQITFGNDSRSLVERLELDSENPYYNESALDSITAMYTSDLSTGVVGIEKSDLIEKAKEHLLDACDEFAEYFDSSVNTDLVINHVNNTGRVFTTTPKISDNFLNSLAFDDDIVDINAKDTIIYKDFYIIDLTNKVLVYVEILYTNIEDDGLVVSHSGVLYYWDSVEDAWALANDNNFQETFGNDSRSLVERLELDSENPHYNESVLDSVTAMYKSALSPRGSGDVSFDDISDMI